MAVSRAQIVDQNFIRYLEAVEANGPPRPALDEPVRPGYRLTGRDALRLFEAQLESRTLDLLARELKAEGDSFYTIGSSGHEGNVVLADALLPGDTSFLHYRSGGFYCALANKTPGPAGAFDVLLGAVASIDEPIAGGRHKVFGSVELNIPPQTSTIASHLPKALGFAVAIDRKARFEGIPEKRIAMCTFGDASSNHSTAAGAINAACWASYQNVPAPVLFVCEDNGFGISVRTPEGWIQHNYGSRPGLKYFYADGLDLVAAWEAATEAAHWVRTHRKPAFLHLRTVRILGHAGSDVEQLYRTKQEIEDNEARDPLISTASILIGAGLMSPDEIKRAYADMRTRITALATEAVRRKKIVTSEEVVRPLFFHDVDTVARAGGRAATAEQRQAHFGTLPETSDRPRHLALQLNRALHDIMLAHSNTILFGEDVARKGGVYHVTNGLTGKFGVGRAFNTLLDETTILGLAIGAGQAGLLPLPEVQYLAYLMNAIDQLRGEAGSLQFFSNGQYANPMVVRIASLAYQRGFGGHFHNDNGIAALREIPGLLLAAPSRGDDAVRMLRTLVGAAASQGRVCVMLEPIALYMTKDLLEPGDNQWTTLYPEPGDTMPVGEVGVYGNGTALTIASYSNGLWMSLRVAARLADAGHDVRVVDIRWIMPLSIDPITEHAVASGKLLIVDECRRSSGIADTVAAEVNQRAPQVEIRRVMAPDTYIPLGAAANLVLVQEADIETAALDMLGEK